MSYLHEWTRRWYFLADKTNTFWTSKRRGQYTVKLRNWDEIPYPEDYKFGWQKCKKCGKKVPFVLHPNPQLGIIAHESKCSAKNDEA